MILQLPDDDKNSIISLFCLFRCHKKLGGKIASLRANCSYCKHEFNFVGVIS